QTIRLTDRWTRDDLNGQQQIVDEPLHHLELLVVLTAKAGEAWAGDDEELGDDGRHSSEMPRASRGPAKGLAQIRDGHARLVARRVHVPRGGREQNVCPRLSRQFAILVQVPRIPLEVLM